MTKVGAGYSFLETSTFAKSNMETRGSEVTRRWDSIIKRPAKWLAIASWVCTTTNSTTLAVDEKGVFCTSD
jgi:hypothetical protein